jgi:hypothetical protein
MVDEVQGLTSSWFNRDLIFATSYTAFKISRSSVFCLSHCPKLHWALNIQIVHEYAKTTTVYILIYY